MHRRSARSRTIAVDHHGLLPTAGGHRRLGWPGQRRDGRHRRGQRAGQRPTRRRRSHHGRRPAHAGRHRQSQRHAARATGAVSVAPGAPAGAHAVDCRICECAAPAHCASAVATVHVAATPIAATDDASVPVNGASGGHAITSVLGNDDRQRRHQPGDHAFVFDRHARHRCRRGRRGGRLRSGHLHAALPDPQTRGPDLLRRGRGHDAGGGGPIAAAVRGWRRRSSPPTGRRASSRA